ncbi:MAG: single-stranded DNA-binding protein [Gammaproteobacteria bacterium]
MARGINKVILVGNLGRDPEIRYSDKNMAFGTLNLATTNQWYSREKQTNEERTDWHRVRVLGKLAEIAEKYLRQGHRVYIEGRLETRSYDKGGETRYITEVIAREMLMLGGKGGDTDLGADASQQMDRPARNTGPSGSSAPSAAKQEADFEDDLPF